MGLFDGTPLERPVTCERCGKADADCACPRGRDGASAAGQKARVRREKRRGKWCCVVTELDLDDASMKSLLKDLRTALGTGGGITDGDIVIQGDHRQKIVERLSGLGYDAKASGG